MRVQLNFFRRHYSVRALLHQSVIVESDPTCNVSRQLVFLLTVQLPPAAPETHLHSGELLFKLGRVEDAKAELQRAVELDPKHAGAHFQLSRAYAKLGDASNAKNIRGPSCRFTEPAGRLPRQQQSILMFESGEKHGPARE